MHQVKVKRSEIIGRIKKNRDQHKAVVHEALAGYRKAVVSELDRMIKDAKNGKKIRTHVTLVQPEDHTRDYDRVLDMLTSSVEEEITLDTHSFNRYMRDEWEWDEQFAGTISGYANSRVARAYLSNKVQG